MNSSFAAMPLRSRIYSVIMAAGMPLLPLFAVDSPTTSWNGTTAAWATATNWSNGLPSATNSALFNAAFVTALQPTLAGNVTSQGLWLDAGLGKNVNITGATGNVLTITGTATLNGQTNAGIIMSTGAAENRNLTIATGVSLSNATGFYNNQASGALSITGTLSGGAAAALTISNSSAGTTTLSGTNTYSGGTILAAGALLTNNLSALGTGTVAVNAGSLTLSSSLTIGNLTGTGGVIQGNGAAVRTLTIGSGNGTGGSYAGVIQDGGAALTLTKTGTGTIALSGANTYTGPTNLNGGTLLLDFSLAGAPAANILNTTTNSSKLNFGGGTLTIKGVNNGATTNSQRFNDVSITAGTSAKIVVQQNGAGNVDVSLGAISTRGAQSAFDFTLPTTGTVTTTTTTASSTVLVDAANHAYATANGGASWLANNAGTLTALTSYTNTYATGNNVDVLDNDAVGTVSMNTLRLNASGTDLAISGIATVETGGILVTAAGTSSTISGGTLTTTVGSAEMIIHDYGTLNISSTIANANAGATLTAVTYAGTGTTTLSGANTYTGTTSITQGTVRVGAAQGVGSGAFGANGVISISNDSTAVMDLNGFNYAISSLTSSAAGGGRMALGTQTLTLGDATTNANFSGSITGSGSGTAVVKVGSGTQTLSGASTYTGGTVIREGNLTLTNATAAGTGTNAIITIGNGTTAAKLTVSNGITLANKISTVGGSGVTNNIEIFTGSVTSTTLSGAVTLGSNLRITNSSTAGTQPGLSGAFTGTGNLILDNSAIGSGNALILNSGANLNFVGTVTHLNSASASGSITRIDSVIGPSVTGLIQNGGTNSTLALVGTNTFAADTTLSSGILNLRNSLAIQNSVLNISSAGTLTFGNNSVNTIAATMAGLSGAGNINLRNMFSPVANVTLTLGNSLSAGAYTGVTLNPIYSGVLSSTGGSSAVIKTGTNTQTFTGANTYSGGTTVSGGTLLASNSAPLTTSATGSGSVSVTGTATLGGTGSVTGGTSQTITLASTSFLMVGQTHGAGGSAQDFQLGSGTATNVGIDLAGTVQFDIFEAGSMDDINSVGSASTYNTLGSANDLLEIYTTGALDLDGVVVALSANSLTGLVAGQSWKLIDWSNAGAIPSDQTITLASSTFEGFNVVGTTITDGSGAGNGYYITLVAVPEPGRAMLLLGGIMALLARRVRRRKF